MDKDNRNCVYSVQELAKRVGRNRAGAGGKTEACRPPERAHSPRRSRSARPNQQWRPLASPTWAAWPHAARATALRHQKFVNAWARSETFNNEGRSLSIEHWALSSRECSNMRENAAANAKLTKQNKQLDYHEYNANCHNREAYALASISKKRLAATARQPVACSIKIDLCYSAQVE